MALLVVSLLFLLFSCLHSRDTVQARNEARLACLKVVDGEIGGEVVVGAPHQGMLIIARLVHEGQFLSLIHI